MSSTVDVQFVVVTESMAITSAMRKSANWASTGVATILGAPPLSYLEAVRKESVARRESSVGTGDDSEQLTAASETAKTGPDNSSNDEVHADSGSAVSTPASESSPSKLVETPVSEPNEAENSENSGLIAHETAEEAKSSNVHPEHPHAYFREPPSPEALLILNFGALRAAVAGKSVATLNCGLVMRPFLEVVKSPLVSGHVTALALSAIERFLSVGVLSPESPHIDKCINDVVYALCKCRFEASDRTSDDAVMVQLMLVTEKLIVGPCGAFLTSKTASRVVETCMRMVAHLRRGDMMRRAVLSTLSSLVQTVFSRYEVGTEFQHAGDSILHVLVEAMSPDQLRTTNTMRLTVLDLLKTCFEVGASRFSTSPTLVNTIQTLWKHLAQLVRTNNCPLLVRDSLIMAATIMKTAPKEFKHEFAFVILYVLTSLTPLADLPRENASADMFYSGVPNRPLCVKSAPIEPGSNILTVPTAALHKSPETREAMVEALATWAAAYPCIYSDLYVNFDCDKGCFDLCEDLVGFLCRNAYPDSATWSTASVPPLCLEAVLSGLTALVFELDAPNSDENKEISDLLAQHESKAVETMVAETFNKSAAKGIKAMVEYKLIPSTEPQYIAKFLIQCKKINKAVLGKFFAKSENKEILENYVQMFDFRGLRIDEALRLLLCSFRLPGESAQIENLLQKFADQYIAAGDKVEDSSDAAFILAYAVLMLNTDHFSPTLKRRMDYDAFLRNVKGVNKALPDSYVKEIFDGITSQEIIMPEEHDTDETFEHSWREDVLSLKPSSPYISNVHRSDVTRAVFETSWRPLVSTLSFVFATATDDLVFRRVITGFHQLAQLATEFGSHQALNHIVACLSHISVLASGDISFNNTNIMIRIENETDVVVSDLSTQFGADLKAQMASITLFAIVRLGSKVISANAYGLLAKALVNLYIYGLWLPKELEIAPVKNLYSFDRPKSGKSVGIFSALSNYLTSSPNTPDEPSDESVDVSLAAEECIKACDVDSVLIDLKQSEAFCLGCLEVLPSVQGEQFAPAQELLLKLILFCAPNDDILTTASDRAVSLGFNALALQLAPKNHALTVLERVSSFDDATVECLLNLTPSPEVWTALSNVDRPQENVCRYIAQNADDISEESVSQVLKPLSRLIIDESGQGVNALEVLARKFRHSSVYTSILATLGQFSGSGDAKTRENALSVLQTELLQDDQTLKWSEVVDEVLMPHVLETVLKPEVWKRDPKGMEMTRQQVSSLIGKVFLHLCISLEPMETDSDTEAWIQVLQCMDRLLSSRRQPALEESVIEMLKNVILVTKLSSKGTPQFWDRTEEVLNGFLPEVAEMLHTEEPIDLNKPNSKQDAEENATDAIDNAEKDAETNENATADPEQSENAEQPENTENANAENAEKTENAEKAVEEKAAEETSETA